jgi:hypothetical protein
MSSTDKIHVIAVGAGIVVVAAYIGLLLVPVWKSYSGVWQRVAASFLSLYVLAACLALGAAVGAGVVWIWDRAGG